MLARIRKSREDEGFTLIELLVVIIIIGILSAIAIPTFLNQRQKAWRKAATSDLRNNATKMEEYFDESGSYAGATPATAAFKASDDVVMAVVSAGPGGYCLSANHTKLTDAAVDYWLDSAVGKPSTTQPATCAGYTPAP